MARASSSLPVPLSPVMSTGSSVCSKRWTRAVTWRIALLSPIMAGCGGRGGGLARVHGLIQTVEQSGVLGGAFQQQASQKLRRHARQVVEADARDGAFDARRRVCFRGVWPAFGHPGSFPCER